MFITLTAVETVNAVRKGQRRSILINVDLVEGFTPTADNSEVYKVGAKSSCFFPGEDGIFHVAETIEEIAARLNAV